MIPLPIGSIVRVKDPEGYISEFARKFRDRDAIVRDVILDYGADNQRKFQGRLQIEFQKRGNRGKTFTEIMNQRELILKDAP